MRKGIARSSVSLPIALCILAVAAGCQSLGFRFLNLIGLSQEPVVIAWVTENPAGPVTLSRLIRQQQLHQALGKKLNRPIVADLCLPIQLQTHLDLGVCHLAVVSPVQYARIPDPSKYRVVAATADEQKRAARSALLIVPVDAPESAIADLRGKRIAFGHDANVRTHAAGLLLLAENGLQRSDLQLEILPIPGAVKTFLDDDAVAQSVLRGESAAGFVDEAAWENWPEEAAEALPSKGNLRILGRTIPTFNRVVLASPKLSDADFASIQTFYLTADELHPDAVAALNLGGFREPAPEILSGVTALARVAPAPETQPAEPEMEPIAPPEP